MMQEPSLGCPKGIEIDPPSKVGRNLRCEHRIYRGSFQLHAELTTVLTRATNTEEDVSRRLGGVGYWGDDHGEVSQNGAQPPA
eukprot:6911091-Pyramimonas_sp.AAC.1